MPAKSLLSRSDLFQRRNPLLLPCRLTLLVSSLHRHTLIGSGWIDGAFVVLEEVAWFSASNNKASPNIFLESFNSFLGRVVGNEASVGINELWFTHNIEIVGLDDQLPTASSAVVTFIFHASRIACRLTACSRSRALTRRRRKRFPSRETHMRTLKHDLFCDRIRSWINLSTKKSSAGC